jgi:polysaccharide export outer membrane protein
MNGMNCTRRTFARILGWCGGISVLGLITACETLGDKPAAAPGAPPISQGTGILRVGDKIVVVLSDIPGGQLAFEQVIADDGKITLHQNHEFVAAGKAPHELEIEIRNYYVPKQYTQMSVNIRASDRFFFVSGDVKLPNRYVHNGNMRLMNAIATAGGFTEFAKKKAVVIIRADTQKRETINTEKIKDKPELDAPIYPGDQIHVPRRF